MELRIIWQIIWRRKWIIIQAFLVIFLTSVIASYLLTPLYETTATVLIKPAVTSSSVLSSIGLQDLNATKATGIETHTSLNAVDAVLEKVISSLQVRDHNGDLMLTSDFKASKFLISTILPQPYVTIAPITLDFTSPTTDSTTSTDLFTITASSSDADESTMIANKVAEFYVEQNLIQRREDYRNSRIFIEEQINKAKTDYVKALEDIKNYKLTKKTVDLDTETKTAIDKMAELLKGKEDSIISLSETKAKIETLKRQLGKQNETVVSSTALNENPQIAALKISIKDLDLELAGALNEKTNYHPDIIALKQKIKKAREELKKEIDIFKESSKDLETLEQSYAALGAHIKSINKDIDKHLSQLSTIPDKSFIQSQLTLRLTSSQTIYNTLLDYLNKIGVAEATTLSDVKIVQLATIPDIGKPTSPNKLLYGIMGGFLGLFFGCGLGFLVDYFDNTIKSPADVKRHGLTFLATIPKFKKRESPLIFNRDPKDPVCESYRTARNSIKFASIDKAIKSLLITSSIEGEGKTTTLGNLGISFTFDGKEVLLVDTDLRRPSIHNLFGLPNSIGITNILAGKAEISEAINKTDIKGLSVLTSGPVPLDPGRLIESQKMQQLIKELIQKYDLIILDAPPVLIANDAVVLAGYVDSSILVLESKKITSPNLTQALALLNQSNIQPLGAILNKVMIESGGYYNYYKRQYYKK